MKVAPVEPQLPGGGGPVPAVPLHGIQDRSTPERIHAVGQGKGRAPFRGAPAPGGIGRRRQWLRTQVEMLDPHQDGSPAPRLLASRPEHAATDDILQLADIPRPFDPPEPLVRLVCKIGRAHV